jgi:hypothetical protein
MYYPYHQNTFNRVYNQGYNKEYVFTTLTKVIEQGLTMMNNNSFGEQQFQTWLEFSKEMVQLVTKDTSLNLYANYMSIILTMYNTNLSPQQKTLYCVKYLLEIMKSL